MSMNIVAPNQISVKPIEDFIFEGLIKRLREVFGAHVVLSNATDEIQTLAKLKLQNVKYPFMFVSLTSLNPTKDSYRAMPMIRRGFDIFLSTDNKQVLKVSAMPVDFVFEVKYFHNDFPAIVRFAKRWLFSAAAGFMKFTIIYGESFDIGFLLSEDISIPKREANPENIQEYPVVSTITCRGYMSEEKLRNQQAATEVDVTAYQSEQAKKAGSTFFAFNKKWDTPTMPVLDQSIIATSDTGTTASLSIGASSLGIVGTAPIIA
jgi:hypothetical protein